MTVENAIKKLERLSGIKPVFVGNEYEVTYKGNVISFSASRGYNGDEVNSYHIRKVDDVSNAQKDYFAGVFYDNLTQLFNHI